jgi:hypothetical protein
MKTNTRAKKKIMFITGLFFIIAGVLFNEWFIAATISPDGVLMTETRSFIWIFDFACILWGVSTIVFHKNNLIVNVNLLFVAIVMTLFVVEGALRISPQILGRDFANGILTKYTTNQDGIYFLSANCQGTPLNLMKPNFRTMMYYNGYRWLHETDRYGFRNPKDREEADILLLGDSFIYGHGVNVDQTVAHFLEHGSTYSVVNLARQGDCAFQQVFLLSQYITHFKPRYVFYFFYENDITDLYLYLTEDEMTEFIKRPIEDISDCYRDSLPHLRYSEQTSKAIRSEKAFQPYVLRVYKWLSSRRKLRHIIKKTMKPAEAVKEEKRESTSFSGIAKKSDSFYYPAAVRLVSVTGPMPASYSVRSGQRRIHRSRGDIKTGEMTMIVQRREKNEEEKKITRQALSDNDNPDSLGWRYTTKAILKMRYLSELQGATFVIAPITPENRKHFEILRDISKKYKIQFIDTSIIDKKSNTSLFLPHDGHFSEKGARTMAELVLHFLDTQKRI